MLPQHTPQPPAPEHRVTDPTHPTPPPTEPISPLILIRAAFGGALMGLANLVPGISGGTMLLAAGIYQRFIDAIADITSLRFRPAAILTLAAVVGAALLAIILLAGPVAALVVNHPWIAYSLFIGLTLGGVPLVWGMARPINPTVWTGLALGFAAMAALAIVQAREAGAGTATYSSGLFMMFLAGLAGASAMILPGLSGGYLLLILGVYVPILQSIDRCKDAVANTDLNALIAEWTVIVPVGLGVVAGVVGVSHLLRWVMHRYEKATLGVLLGLLLGAVVGLYPFQRPVPPEPGHTIAGTTITEDNLDHFLDDPSKWPRIYEAPTPARAIASLGLIGVGFLTTLAVARLGNSKPRAQGATV
ncbi:MAG: DUF368 domain-containing protein [Phycisphaeraceae bacterium]|nr:MAG: DUF368 domain-containing protein [Phycisphaeraceae bacterium]